MRSIELLPLTRPWPPAPADTDSKLASPDCTDQPWPSEAVPHPPEADRPAKVSRAKTVPPATGVPPGVGVGEGVGLGVGLGVGDRDGVGEGLGVGVRVDANNPLIRAPPQPLPVN